MATGKKHDSFWFWMFALFVCALPCIGWIMVLVWAFSGDNETRKNYFRALIAWFVIISVVWIVLATIGLWPFIIKEVQTWIHQIK
jgi:hypothetical protein